MKFLIIITLSFVLGLALGTSSNDQHNNKPCKRRNTSSAYNSFLNRHILPACFATNSRVAWRRHIRRIGCCSTRLQSFILHTDKGKVAQICNGRGRTLAGCNYAGNLCISDYNILVYHVTVNTANCKIRKVRPRRQRVIVACDKVNNGCRPVHYERYRGQRPGNCRCRP